MLNVRRRLWVTLAAGLWVGGCAGTFASDPVDARSAAAPRVSQVQDARHAYPDLRRLPAKPPEIAPATFASRADAVRGDRARLAEWVRTHPAEVTDTEGFAQASRGRVPAEVLSAVPPEDQAARTAAFAERLRKAAQPPPPPP